MDYVIRDKDDLIRDFDEIMDGQITWSDLSVEEQNGMYMTVTKNISYSDPICTTEEFYDEVRSAISVVGIDQREDVKGLN